MVWNRTRGIIREESGEWMDNTTISITVYGRPVNDWQMWYQDAKGLFSKLGYDYNYFGANIFADGKIKTVSRSEKKLLAVMGEESNLEAVSMFSLPRNFKSASFSYDVMLVRNQEFITLSLNESDYDKLDETEVVKLFSEYVENPRVEIYELDRYEVPLLYAYKCNSTESFKTLKIRKVL